jgi:hypothetical protein
MGDRPPTCLPPCDRREPRRGRGGYLFLELIIIIANIANNKIKLNIINNIAPLVYKL